MALTKISGSVIKDSVSLSGNVSVGGTLTYEDVTNVDAVGVITAREGIFIPDNKVLHLGNVSGTGDLQIYHDTNHSYVKDVGTGDLVLQTQGGHVRIKYGSHTMALFQPSGFSQLYFNNNVKLATTNTGAVVTGVLTATSFSGDGSALTGITGTTINNNAANRIITGEGGTTLNGEANLTWDGNSLDLTAGTGNQFPIQIRNDFTPNSQRADYASLLNATSNNTLRLGSINSNGGVTIQATRGNDSAVKHYLLLNPDDGNVGINEVNPQQQLHVHDDTTYHGIFVNGSAAPRITFARQTTTTGEWSVGIDGTNGNNFAINNSGDNSNNKIVISSSQVSLYGHVGVPNGNIIMGSTRGIDFSATADATHTGASGANPTTDSEVLTDYEHGTWTPRLRAYDHTGGAGWGTMKYTDGTDVIGTGRYVKVGRYVWCGFKFESGSKVFDSNWTYWSIDNTPYGANHYDKASGSLYVNQTNFFTDSNSHIGGFVHGNESYMVVNKPNGHSNATINTSNNNRYCYGHISIYSSRY